jgi:uncharacterized membrane protein YgcG
MPGMASWFEGQIRCWLMSADSAGILQWHSLDGGFEGRSVLRQGNAIGELPPNGAQASQLADAGNGLSTVLEAVVARAAVAASCKPRSGLRISTPPSGMQAVERENQARRRLRIGADPCRRWLLTRTLMKAAQGQALAPQLRQRAQQGWPARGWEDSLTDSGGSSAPGGTGNEGGGRDSGSDGGRSSSGGGSDRDHY